MSSSLNKALLIGHLGKDPEIRYTADGSPVANFSLATNEFWVDKNGTRQERTQWNLVLSRGAELDPVHTVGSEGLQDLPPCFYCALFVAIPQFPGICVYDADVSGLRVFEPYSPRAWERPFPRIGNQNGHNFVLPACNRETVAGNQGRLEIHQ